MLIINNLIRNYPKKLIFNTVQTLSTTANSSTIGFIGLGSMGSKMVTNLSNDNKKLLIYDKDINTVNSLINSNTNNNIAAGSISDIADNCNIIISMLPNDKIVTDISNSIVNNKNNNNIIHISCSTISPTTARKLSQLHSDNNCTLITAPVFARPDGLAKRQATWMVAGPEKEREIAKEILSTKGSVVDMGDDVGAANVVKLCGNFLIAASIEAIGESMVLAEKNNVDQKRVMDILSSSIFDCLIYKGYGQRVSERDHRPGGFSLELGLKDVSLVSQAARETDTPMPFLSVLLDRYVSAKAKGRSEFDWSAIGLSIAEEAGVDVSKDVERTINDVKTGNFYK